jgi:hypothetical protein
VRVAAIPRLRGTQRPGRFTAVGYLVAVAVAGALAVMAVKNGTVTNPVMLAGAGVMIGVALWMFLSERLELTLGVLLLYLGVADGYLKLKTGSSMVTLGRDVLLYAIALGAFLRLLMRREPIRMPALSGWILALVGIVLVQMLNPGSQGVAHTLGALRPHLEFIPLFFLGYATLRSNARLRNFIFLLVVVGAANGVVSLIQFNLTPDQLSAWGPGYAKRIKGTGDVAARSFADKAGTKRVRPFGLASDVGVGGYVGLIGTIGAIALLASAWKRRVGRWALLLTPLVLLAVITSQGRTILLITFIGILAYLAMSTVSNRLIPTIAAATLGMAVSVAVIVPLLGGSASGQFDRYRTITPSKLISTTDSSRGVSFAAIPKLAVSYPMGVGLGFAGPATNFAGATRNHASNGETGPTFLLSELGLAGLIIMAGLNINLLVLAVRRIRHIPDPELRAYLAAFAAIIVGLLGSWASSVPMAISPTAPFFWAAAGGMAYWLGGPSHSWRARQATGGQPELRA